MSFTDKLTQRIKERQDEEQNFDRGQNEYRDTFEASPFYGVEQIRNVPACIDLRFHDKSCKSIPYSFILEIDFDPSDGIVILTTTKKISVTGRNLKLLYTFLSAFRVRFIQENIGNDLTEEKALFVKAVKVEEL